MGLEFTPKSILSLRLQYARSTNIKDIYKVIC